MIRYIVYIYINCKDHSTRTIVFLNHFRFPMMLCNYKQTLHNSALRKWKFQAQEKQILHAQKYWKSGKWKFCTQRIQILYSKTAMALETDRTEFCAQKKLVRSGKENSALKNGNTELQKWNLAFSIIFHTKSGNSALKLKSRAKFHDHESWGEWTCWIELI